MLDRLEQENLFLIPLDDERRWYRYHAKGGEYLEDLRLLTKGALAEMRALLSASCSTRSLAPSTTRALPSSSTTRNGASQAQIEPLAAATGGNPKAIEMTLGLIKYERRPLQQVVDDLYAARGELFEDLFTRAWSLLDEAARRVLLVMTFFPASASSEALSATADVQGFSFGRAVERLSDLALLDVQ
ncbi:hypothetical protein EKD04_013540 [Chloroflexales bacterium ZM16-3]|nr:hypothetical protein [Chloroflexales bacterium ZM16-3]